MSSTWWVWAAGAGVGIAVMVGLRWMLADVLLDLVGVPLVDWMRTEAVFDRDV